MKTDIILSAIIALAVGTNASAAAHKESIRADYYNLKGERIWSDELNSIMMGIELFTVAESEKGWYVTGNQTRDENTSIGSLKFVAWGTEAYELKIETELPVDYTVISSDSQAESRAGSVTAFVKCGDIVSITTELPDGAFPNIRWINEYTDVLPGGSKPFWKTDAAVPFGTYGILPNDNGDYTDSEKLAEILKKHIGSEGIFRRDEETTDKNRWNIRFEMPNGPCTLRIGYEYADSGHLRDVTDKTLYRLYTQRMTGFAGSNSGESFILQTIGDAMSQDVISNMMSDWSDEYYTFGYLKKANYSLPFTAWDNYYSSIIEANMVLENLDLFTMATAAEKERARAQLLALRAHCYTRILQLFGKRWNESDNGSAFCAPLILSCSDIRQPLATMSEIYRQAEADLSEAEEFFRTDNYERTEIIQPDLYVTLALKIRLNMLAEKWQKVRTDATEILDRYPISTNADIATGFYVKRDSWIWGAPNRHTFTDGSDYQIYYYAPQNFNACNGSYTNYWRMGANAIDRDLYLKMAQSDVRRAQFAMPEQLNDARYKRVSSWYDSQFVMSGTHLFAGYNNYWETTSERLSGEYDTLKPEYAVNGAFKNDFGYIPVPFGAQVKFYGTGIEYGYDVENPDAATLFLRSDEVLLSAAEAAAHTGDEAEARRLLTQLNGQRIAGYSCEATGEQLLEEIMTSRRIELWGEGHGWFDFKRWKLPIHRNLWVEKDTSSGNWPPSVAPDVATDTANGWRFPIPAYYLKQNPNIDISKMEYNEVSGY